MSDKRRQPAQVFHPGEHVQDELTARKWTAKDLADKTTLSENTVNRIVNCERRVTAVPAHQLSKAFGTGMMLWLNLQAAYDSWESSRATSSAKICEPEITDEEN